MKARLSEIEAWLSEQGGVVVAFSGGVDSTLLVHLAGRSLGRDAVAVTITGPLQHDFEIRDATRTAERVGIRHLVRDFSPLTIDEVRENVPERCYFCKKAIFSILKGTAHDLGIAAVVDGTNADDTADYRPGIRALAELDIRSPLLELGVGKEEIRRLSRLVGIPGFDRPPMACLASRFPYGDRLTPERIDRVREAEAFLMGLGFRVVRVRSLGETAKIEVGADELTRLSSFTFLEYVRAEIKKRGFGSVVIDPDGYRTGSMNMEISGRPPEGGTGYHPLNSRRTD